MTTAAAAPPDTHLERFDRVERLVHWSTAALFGTLMLTGAALYAGPISTLVGRRDLVRTVHVVAGIALPIPLIVGLLGRWGRGLRTDLGRLNRWTGDDRRWWRRSQRPSVRLHKFNPGQKLNATFLGATIVLMLGSGIMLKWFELVPLDWRVGATFVHDWVALAIWISVGAHIFFAIRDDDAMHGMRHGTVPARWARARRPRWYEDETGRPADRFKQSVGDR